MILKQNKEHLISILNKLYKSRLFLKQESPKFEIMSFWYPVSVTLLHAFRGFTSKKLVNTGYPPRYLVSTFNFNSTLSEASKHAIF